MKTKPLTVSQVLRELRCQERQNNYTKRNGETAVARDQAACAAEALRFAVRFIHRHRITLADLQRVLDEQKGKKGGLSHYR
jgi:hypothetical protein